MELTLLDWIGGVLILLGSAAMVWYAIYKAPVHLKRWYLLLIFGVIVGNIGVKIEGLLGLLSPLGGLLAFAGAIQLIRLSRAHPSQ